MSGKESTTAAAHAQDAATTVGTHAAAVSAGLTSVVQKVSGTFTTDLPRFLAEVAGLGKKVVEYAAATETALDLARAAHTQAIAGRGAASTALREGSMRVHDTCSAAYGRAAAAADFPSLPSVASFDALSTQVGTLITRLPLAAKGWKLPAGATAVDVPAQVAQLTALKGALDQQLDQVRKADAAETAALAESVQARALLHDVPGALIELLSGLSRLGARKDLIAGFTTHHHAAPAPPAAPAVEPRKPVT